MKIRFCLLLVICSFLFTSCVEDVDIKKTFGIEPQIVLFCCISPQADTNHAYLYNSLSFFSTRTHEMESGIYILDNAIVEISDDNKNWVRLSYNDFTKSFIIRKWQLHIEEGKTYYIKASCAGFESVNSSCTVPYMREVNLQRSQKMQTCESYLDQHRVHHLHDVFTWTDYPNEENYYMLNAIYSGWHYNYDYEYEYDDDGNIIGSGPGTIIDSSYYTSLSPIGDKNTGEGIFTDQGRDGKNIEIIDYHCNLYGDIKLGDTLYFTIMDKSCYLYEFSLDKYSRSMGVEFMSLFEPVLVYSNIENGLGLFGAFCTKQYSVSSITRP